jgi:D-alanyl-D-alanine dipeptidase
LIDIRTIVSDAVIDLHYATADNFVHHRLYPTDARCLVHESMAPGLVTAARVLRRAGDVLVFWEAMNAGGLAVYAGEWWHFDGPGSRVHRPILDVPVD